MLTLRPNPGDLRAGMSRRRWLQIGLGGSLLSLATPPSSKAGGTPILPHFGRAKSCIFVYLFGGPSHIDIWDMKPTAPDGIRGEFRPIDTNVPGIQITEHLPRLARLADQYSVVRSMTHGDAAHGSAGHTMMTGRRPRALGEVGPTPEDFPPSVPSSRSSARPRARCRPTSRCPGPSPPAPTSSPATRAASSATESIRFASPRRPEPTTSRLRSCVPIPASTP